METLTGGLRGYRFGVFEVDLRAGEVRKNGLKVKLRNQPFQVLGMAPPEARFFPIQSIMFKAFLRIGDG